MPILKNYGRITGKHKSTGRQEVFHYFWDIRHFRKLYNSIGGWHESPVFFTGSAYEWTLKLYVAGYDESVRDYIGFEASLKKNFTPYNPKLITIECAIITDYPRKFMIKTATIVTQNPRNQYTVIFKDFISKYQLVNNFTHLVNGHLDISCRITFDKPIDDNYIACALSDHKINQLDIFEKFFNNEQFSDFQLVVGLKQFNVHRLILAARSPVFQAMFDSKMRENSEGRVFIDDVEPDIMEKLLRFVYVGELDVEDLADQVLIAAEKYQLDDLKLICENILSRKLDYDNVYDILLLADTFNATELKKKTMMFFSVNMRELSTKSNFQESIASLPPALQTQIICNLAKTK